MKIMIFLLLWCFPSEEITPKEVYTYCVERDILYPEIVTAQAIKETGWFNCNNCSLDKNNIFGFWYKGSFIKFDDWKQSVEYYKRWQDKWYDPNRDYYDYLACMYINSEGNCIKYAKHSLQYNEDVKSIVTKYSAEWSN